MHKMQLLNRSPGSTEEERITTNKPVDTGVVMKERLPVNKGTMSILNELLFLTRVLQTRIHCGHTRVLFTNFQNPTHPTLFTLSQNSVRNNS